MIHHLVTNFFLQKIFKLIIKNENSVSSTILILLYLIFSMSNYKVQQKLTFTDRIKNKLGLIDFYGTPINLQVEKQERYISPIGIGSSIAVIIICSILLISNLKDVIDKKNPNVISQQEIMLDTPSFPLLKNNFTLVTLLVDLSTLPIENRDSLYKIEYKQCVRNRLLDDNGKVNVTQKYRIIIFITSCISLSSELCSPEKHFGNRKQNEFFQNFRFQNLLCLNSSLWEKNNVELKGFSNSDKWSYLQVRVSICKNTSEFQGCASPEVINKSLARGYYVTYIFDNLVDQSNPDEPFELFTKLWSTTYSVDFSKTVITSYSITSTITDKGLFSESLNEKSALIYSGETQFQDKPNPNFLINQQIQLDNKRTITYRKYLKVQDVFGNIGGLYNVLYYGLFIIITPIVQMIMNLSIIDKIFTFEIETESIKENGENKLKSSIFHNFLKSRQSLHLIRSQTVLSNAKKKRPQDYDREYLVKQFVDQRKGSLNLGFFALASLIFGRKTEKAQIQYAINKIYQKLDVMYILNKLFEIEKLKNILLDDQQLKLFNYMPKPCIPINLFKNNKQSVLEENLKVLEQYPQFQPILAEEKTEFKKIIEAIEAYKLIINKQQKSNLDYRVMQLLDEDIQDLFDILVEEDTSKKMESNLLQGNLPFNSAQGRESYHDLCDREIKEQDDRVKIEIPSFDF